MSGTMIRDQTGATTTDAVAAAEFAARAARRSPPARIAGPASVIGSVFVHGALLALLTFALAGQHGEREALIEFEVGVAPEPAHAIQTDPHGSEPRELRRVEEIRPEEANAGTRQSGESLARLAPGSSAFAAAGPDGRSPAASGGPASGEPASGMGRGLPSGRELAAGGAVGCLWGVGIGQPATSYVYVLDRSGSMQDTFHALRRELLRTIGSLGEQQRFNVIWFSDGPAELLAPGLIHATDENKRLASELIRRIAPRGLTRPGDALRRGLEMRPDVLFLLSDGDFAEQNSELLEQVSRWRRAAPRTKVNTILFAADEDADGAAALRRIAEAGGGSYKHVSQDGADP